VDHVKARNHLRLQWKSGAERPILDIVVDGRPLLELFAGRRGLPPDLVSPLGWGVEAHQAHTIRRFLLEASGDLPGNRNSVLVCRECGDLGCGAYSARFERRGDVVTWSEFGFQNSYEPTSLILESGSRVPALTFDWVEYEDAFAVGPSSRP
jgi:hypothetical protein